MPNSRALRHAALVLIAAAAGCAPLNPGVAGSPDVVEPDIEGTVFAIFFENENANNVLHPSHPTFYELAQQYAVAGAYVSNTHPSLANYVMMTSGDTQGITNSAIPMENVRVGGTDNLADQLDAGGVRWRAYFESMETPCRLEHSADHLYVANHNPFLYYPTMTDDLERCRERLVDYDAHFAADLAEDRHDFMWIAPNQCHNMHDCPSSEADAWLARIIPQIMESPGYRRGGAIFVMFDEGHLRIGSAAANLPIIVVSERLIGRGIQIDTRFDHRSFLATLEDHFGLPRIPTTVDATPMGEFFRRRARLAQAAGDDAGTAEL